MKPSHRLRTSWIESALALLGWLARFRGAAQGEAEHLRVGEAGEREAYLFLLRKGYRVVARRWHAGGASGDVDLIAWDGSVLCFVEVKTRSVHDTNAAEITVHEQKRRRLRRLARRYLRQLPGESLPRARFDVVSVYLVAGEKTEAVHFEGAFGWNEFQ